MDRESLVKELHKPVRRNFPRRKFDVRGIDETWQADLIEMQPYSRENKGFKYMLTVIDIFSKYAWAVPVKQKTGEDVAQAMKSVLSQGRIPKNLQTDRGKEFYNTTFQNLNKINLYSTYSNLKASICERFNRTLKNKMWMNFSLKGSYKWLDILPALIKTYNNRKHRTIGMQPSEVDATNAAKILRKFLSNNHSTKKPKFKIGDKVRVSKLKQVFEKGYTPNWIIKIIQLVEDFMSKKFRKQKILITIL